MRGFGSGYELRTVGPSGMERVVVKVPAPVFSLSSGVPVISTVYKGGGGVGGPWPFAKAMRPIRQRQITRIGISDVGGKKKGGERRER